MYNNTDIKQAHERWSALVAAAERLPVLAAMNVSDRCHTLNKFERGTKEEAVKQLQAAYGEEQQKST